MSSLLKEINNSGKNAKWLKSAIKEEEFVCSLCGGSNWQYDDNGIIRQSNFCPNCGAKMTLNHLFLDIDEAIAFCKDTYNDKSMSLGKYKQIALWLEQSKCLFARNTAKNVLDRKWVQGERGKCPNCKTPVSRAEDRFHCGTCGQKLLWFSNVGESLAKRYVDSLRE